jgi:hypothetical protein
MWAISNRSCVLLPSRANLPELFALFEEPRLDEKKQYNGKAGQVVQLQVQSSSPDSIGNGLLAAFIFFWFRFTISSD